VAGVPEPVSRVAELMSTFTPWWALCGGWAVDAWLGEQTRDHVDIDIATFADDQRAVFEQLAEWNLIAHDALVDQETRDPWDGRPLVLPAHVHARSDDDLELEVLINERSGDGWVLSAEPPIVVPISRTTRGSPWGLPTVVPEILLFYKGTAYFDDEEMTKRRVHDDMDFGALLGRLVSTQRAWLLDAIKMRYPNHPWLERLSDSP
jgi:hypothetical protein